MNTPSRGCCTCTSTRADHILVSAALPAHISSIEPPKQPGYPTVSCSIRYRSVQASHPHPHWLVITQARALILPASNFIVLVVQCCTWCCVVVVVAVICLFVCSVCVVHLTYSPLFECEHHLGIGASVAHTPLHTIQGGMHSRYKARLRLY